MKTASRIIGFDLIRTFSFLCILSFHWSLALWGLNGTSFIPLSHDMIFGRIEYYGRTFVYAGFYVLFISFFLFGFRRQPLREKKTLLPLLFLFFLVWAIWNEDFPYIWDIYGYLLAVVTALLLIEHLQIPDGLLLALSAAFSTLPFWQLEGVFPLPLWLEQILWGVCKNNVRLGDWPLLPWLAYPVAAWASGRLIAKHRSYFHALPILEALGWGLVLILSVFAPGKYYVSNFGEDFACEVFRPRPAAFWAHQIRLLFLMRISLLATSQRFLESQSIIRWISRRQINQRFFLVYFIHYPLCLWAADQLQLRHLEFSGWAVNLTLLLILLASQWAAVVIGHLTGHNSPWRAKLWDVIKGGS